MGCKVKGSSVPAFWGRSASARVEAENIPAKFKALLIDKIESRGKSAFLWQQVTSAYSGNIFCSCNKDTTKRSDITCSSCYGAKLIPGYFKFAHETKFVSSISPGLVLTNTQINTDIKPSRILLAPTALTGTIVSTALLYYNPNEYDWDYKIDVANILNTNSIIVEFSTNGTLYYPIANINNLGIKPIGTGNIYIRVTLSRTILTDRSPEFEIFRIRHQKVNNPYIKILRPQITELPFWMAYGQRIENLGERFWTVSLDVFDSSIIPDTPQAQILENSFYALIKGINAGVRFVTGKLSYSDQIGIFTSQSFETRRVQENEAVARLVY